MIRVAEHAGLDDLGAIEYWIMDGDHVLVKAACRPFIVGGGLRVKVLGGGIKKQPVRPTAQVPRRPGFQQEVSVGSLGAHFEVVAPTGAVVAAFRCRPFYTAGDDLMIRHSTGVRERVVESGASPFPPGTTRPRVRRLHTVRRSG